MVDIYNIPTDFLFDEGFDAVRDYAHLNRLFDEALDNSNEWLRITVLDGVNIDEHFTPSEVLFRMCRGVYERCFQQWSQNFCSLKDGGYLRKDYAQSAADCWAAHLEKK